MKFSQYTVSHGDHVHSTGCEQMSFCPCLCSLLQPKCECQLQQFQRGSPSSRESLLCKQEGYTMPALALLAALTPSLSQNLPQL